LSQKQSNKRGAAGGVATRAAAATIVDRVLRQGRSLEQLLPEIDEAGFSATDRSFVRALVFGTLRFQTRHDALLERLLSKPLKKKDKVLEALLSVGLYQLLESENPDYAVVSSTVDAAKELQRPHARGLINAVLRRFLRERNELLETLEASPSTRYAMPVWLLERLQADYPENWEEIAAASNRQAPMWLRVNQQRSTVKDYIGHLLAADIEAQEGADGAIRLAEPVAVDRLPGFFDGDSSVQDAAAQYAAGLLSPQAGQRVLDACAAPGGKTGHIAELQPELDQLLAIDNSAQRLQRVEENLQRLQLNATVLTADALKPEEWWDGQLFDRILLDAPCSASGVIRRHPDIKHLRRPGDIATLGKLQGDILDALWPLLKPGGFLLYATCSIFRAENQDVVSAFLERQPAAALADMPITPENAIATEGPGIQLLPGVKGDTDGFYYALMQNRQD